MRFVVLRYGGTAPRPADGAALLDDLTTGWSRGAQDRTAVPRDGHAGAPAVASGDGSDTATLGASDGRSNTATPSTSDNRSDTATPSTSDNRSDTAVPSASDRRSDTAVPSASDRRSDTATPSASDGATDGPRHGTHDRAPGPAPHPDPDPDPDATSVAAALAGVLAPRSSLRDDLAALAAVLGVTTVLDETLGSPDVATTVRSRAEGLTLTDGTAGAPDGPLVGLHVLDAPDLDALVDVLTLLPVGTFEVHPVVAA